MKKQTQHRFEVDAECEACKGTGLYIGLAERDGSAVVCYRCKGTGKVRRVFEWTDFEGRRPRVGVSWVMKANPGFTVGTGKGEFELSDFGGMPYEDWVAGLPFPPKSEMRKFVCPAWWYQSADSDKMPRWEECRMGVMFSQCECFADKEKCWARWDREYDR